VDKNDNFAMFEEINEELKHDQMVAFVRQNLKMIASILVTVILGIIIYSTWQDRQKRKMEDITNALLTVVQNPSSKDEHMLGKLLESAPAELRPVLMLMKSGKQLMMGESAEKTLQPILDLSNRRGVDIIWRDLAVLIYASYSTKSSQELVKMLEPLTEEKRPFRFSAMEFIAMAYINDGKGETAVEYLEKILNNNEAPKSMRERITILSQYVKSELKKENTENTKSEEGNK
jgi:hypothetical protein